MKTIVGVKDAGDTGGVPNSGAPIGTVTVENGEVSYSGSVLSEEERESLAAVGATKAIEGGDVQQPETPGEPVTGREAEREPSHEELVNEAVRAVESMGYVTVVR